MSTTYKQVLDGITAVCKKLKKVNGYANDLPDDHIVPSYDAAKLADISDPAYPKCLIFPQKGVPHKQVGGQVEYTDIFHVMLFVKAVKATDDPVTMVLSYLEDFEKLFREYDSLQGVVQDVELSEFEMDGGVLKPEGAVLMSLTIQRFRY